MSTPSNALVPSSVTLAGPKTSGLPATVDDFLPFSVDKIVKRKEDMQEIIQRVLIKGVDYGPQPGARDDQSDVLKKSGAEKLMSTFGLAPQVTLEEMVEDWTGKDHGGEPFFYYRYKIALYRGDRFMGEAVGSCNSWEKKYRYQWTSEEEAKLRADFDRLPKRGGRKTIFEPNFALVNRESTGKYGKPAAYWQQFDDAKKAGTAKEASRAMGKEKKEYAGWEITIDETQYRIPNPNAPDLVNTIQKIAFKRGLVASILVVTNCSDAFTQDLEEEESDGGRHAAAHDSEDPGAGMRGEPKAEKPKKESKKSGDISTKGTGTGTTSATVGHSHTCQSCKKDWPCNLPDCKAADTRFMLCTDCYKQKMAQTTEAVVGAGASNTVVNAAPVQRVIPEEMRLIIERFRVDPKQMVGQTYQLIKDWFTKRGEVAAASYEKAYQAIRAQVSNGKKVSADDHVNNFLDFWELLKKFPEPEDW